MPKGRNKRPISPCVNMCGAAMPSRPVHSPHKLSSSPASAGISSALVRSRSRLNLSNTVRDMLILVLPIRTEDHSGGARGFTVSESKIVGDGKLVLAVERRDEVYREL